MGQALRWILVGIASGFIAAFAVTPLMGSMLYGVEPVDPGTFVALAALLAVVALAASYFPARRAAALDPAQALRSE